MPLTKIAQLRSRGGPIDRALAIGDVILADPHGDHRHASIEVDAQLKRIAGGLADAGRFELSGTQ